MTGEHENLRLLSIFHFVLGGMVALFSLFPLVYILLGVLMLADPVGFSGKGGDAPPEFAGIFVTAFGGVFALAVLSIAACLVIAGRFLGSHRHHTFCTVVAALSCLVFPLGTALGVFTLIVLTKPETRLLFEPRSPAGGVTRASD